jgi:hypothetical protein
MRFAPILMLFSFVLVVGCGSGSGTPAASGTTPAEETATPTEASCDAAVDTEQHATAVRDHEHDFGLILPGEDWELDCEPAAQQGAETFLLGRSASLALIVSVNPFGRDRGMDERQELQALVDRVREGSESAGLGIDHVELEEERISDEVSRIVLSYEVTGEALEREQVRSIHAWTLLWMEDDRILSMHLSWTGPRDRYQDEFVDALRTMVIAFGAL